MIDYRLCWPHILFDNSTIGVSNSSMLFLNSTRLRFISNSCNAEMFLTDFWCNSVLCEPLDTTEKYGEYFKKYPKIYLILPLLKAILSIIFFLIQWHFIFMKESYKIYRFWNYIPVTMLYMLNCLLIDNLWKITFILVNSRIFISQKSIWQNKNYSANSIENTQNLSELVNYFFCDYKWYFSNWNLITVRITVFQ